MKKNTFLLLFCVIATLLQAQTPVTFSIVQINGTGESRAVVDMNNDGLDDIVNIPEVSNGLTNSINIFYQNEDGLFTEENIATQTVPYPSWSLAAGDYNRDGFADLIYGNGSRVSFMKSETSDGLFTGFASVEFPEYVFSQRSNFVDINNDGHLDAFMCHDVEPSVYYLNDGQGNLTYFKADGQDGRLELGNYFSGGNYGSIWIDFDNDRDVDMFMAKCGGSSERSTNQMYQRNADGSFSEIATTLQLDDDIQTWSSAWGDYDNDGDMDVFVGASSGAHKLMENNGNGSFTDITTGSGVASLTATTIENVTHDFNNDGNLDIASGGNILYGNGDNTFTLQSNAISGSNGGFGDLNNDGFIDAYNGSIRMNNGNGNNWVKLITKGEQSNINGIGARIEALTVSGKQIRDVRSGEGFRYMSSMATHFGIGTDEAIESITIYWPSGKIDVLNNPEINTMHRVTEGSTLGLEDTLVTNLILYPNPTDSTLNLNKNIGFENAIYSVFDTNGKRIVNDRLNDRSIDVSNLSTGNYILRVLNNGDILTQKFIKK